MGGMLPSASSTTPSPEVDIKHVSRLGWRALTPSVPRTQALHVGRAYLTGLDSLYQGM